MKNRSLTADQRLQLTGAAILLSSASQLLQAALAT